MNLNFLRQNLRSFLRIPESFSPVATLPVGEVQLPGSRPVTLISAPTPVAPVAQASASAPVASAGGLPRTTLAELGIKLTPQIMADAVVRHQAQQRNRPSAARPIGRPAAKAAPVPASLTENDEGQVVVPAAAPDVVSDVIEKLQSCLQQLRDLHPDVAADDSDDEAQARACLARGDKNGALRHYDAAISAVGARIAQKNARASLRAEPSSRQRASKLITSGFNADPVVASLNASLGRGGLSLSNRAGMALAPVAAVPPATPVVTTTSTAPDRSKLAALQAEKKSIDESMRKSGIYDNASIARQSQLSAQIDAMRKKILNRQ